MYDIISLTCQFFFFCFFFWQKCVENPKKRDNNKTYLLHWMVVKGILLYQPPVESFEVRIHVTSCVVLHKNGRLQWKNKKQQPENTEIIVNE